MPRIWEETVEADSSAGRIVEQTVDVPGGETGSVKQLFQSKGFGFITPDDGGTDVFIHSKQLVDIDGLQRGNTVSYDTEYDDRRESTRRSTAPSFPVVVAGLLGPKLMASLLVKQHGPRWAASLRCPTRLRRKSNWWSSTRSSSCALMG